jgi:hypothetical protein
VSRSLAVYEAHVRCHASGPEIIGRLHAAHHVGYRLPPADLAKELPHAERHAVGLAAAITRAREAAEIEAGLPVSGPLEAHGKPLPPTFTSIGDATAGVVAGLVERKGEP